MPKSRLIHAMKTDAASVDVTAWLKGWHQYYPPC